MAPLPHTRGANEKTSLFAHTRTVASNSKRAPQGRRRKGSKPKIATMDGWMRCGAMGWRGREREMWIIILWSPFASPVAQPTTHHPQSPCCRCLLPRRNWRLSAPCSSPKLIRHLLLHIHSRTRPALHWIAVPLPPWPPPLQLPLLWPLSPPRSPPLPSLACCAAWVVHGRVPCCVVGHCKADGEGQFGIWIVLVWSSPNKVSTSSSWHWYREDCEGWIECLGTCVQISSVNNGMCGSSSVLALAAPAPGFRMLRGRAALQVVAAAAASERVPDMNKRNLMNLLLLGAIGLPTVGLLGPYAYFFVPPG